MKRKVPHSLTWFRFSIRGERWRVVLTSPERCYAYGVASMGTTSFKKRLIAIDCAQQLSEIPKTVMHEVAHAAKGDPDGEGIISEIEGGLWDFARSLGWALPRYPNGFAEMRRHYRKRDA